MSRPIENLREEPFNRAFCPMTYILALAVADQTIEHLDTAQDLPRIRFNPARQTRLLTIRQDKADLPIVRRCVGRIAMSDSKILTSDNLCRLVTELGWRAGYTARLGNYPFRRGYGNELDRKMLSECCLYELTGHQVQSQPPSDDGR